MELKCQNTQCTNLFKPSKHSAGKYCSRSCAAIVNNSLNPKRQRTSRLYNCLNCDKPLLKSSQRKFCDSTCKSIFTIEDSINRWISGEWDGSTKLGGFSKIIRDYLLRINDNKCSKSECRWGIPNPYTGKVILSIEHKDGNSSNHSYGNIELICYNCHTLTPTFGSLNKGNGRRYTPGQYQNDIKNGIVGVAGIDPAHGTL